MESLYNLIGKRNIFDTGEDQPYQMFYGAIDENAFLLLSVDMCDICNESAYYNLGMTDIIFDFMRNDDFESVQYLSESILSVAVTKIGQLISTILGFVRGLYDKVLSFTDQFESDTARWLNKYRKRALNASKYIKDYSYEGFKWNTQYFTDSPYPQIEVQYKESSDKLSRLVNDYNNFGKAAKGNDDSSQREMDKMVAEITKTTDEITKTKSYTKESAQTNLEKTLGCKLTEITAFYMKKAKGSTEPTTIGGFKSISIENMLGYIESSNDRLIQISESIDATVKSLSDAYDKLKNLKVEDYKDIKPGERKPKRSFGSKPDTNEETKDVIYNDREAYSKLTESSKLLSDCVNAMLDVWRMQTNATNSLNFVKLNVIKESTREFMVVLTKFSNQKIEKQAQVK